MTPMQQRAFIIIHDSIKATGLAPTFDQIARGLGVKSKSGVHRIINGLEGRGFIRRMHNRARAIEIIKMPPGVVDPVKVERERCARIVGFSALSGVPLDIAGRAINEGTSFDEFERRHALPGSARPAGLVG